MTAPLHRENRFFGFTLIEILLTIAIIGLITGIAAPILQSVQVRNNRDITVTHYVHALRSASSFAKGVRQDSSWGVYVTDGSITLFKGSSYAFREEGFDEIVVTPSSIVVTGLQEVTFTKVTGVPEQTGTTTFTSSDTGVRTVQINHYGTIEY